MIVISDNKSQNGNLERFFWSSHQFPRQLSSQWPIGKFKGNKSFAILIKAMHKHNSVTKYALLNEHDEKTKVTSW